MTSEPSSDSTQNATCTSRRRVIAGAGAMALATAALSMRRVLAQDGTPVASPAGEAGERQTWLFTQTFTSGFWEPTDDPALFALHLAGGLASTIGFTDRPYRNFMMVPTVDLIPRLWDDPTNPPNAAIIVDHEGTQYTFLLVLTDPVYEAARDTITYTVSVLDAYEGDGLGAAVERVADGALPQSFGAGALFIDSLGCNDSVKACRRLVETDKIGCTAFGYGYITSGYLPESQQTTNTCHLDTIHCRYPCDYAGYNRWCDSTYPDYCWSDGSVGCLFVDLGDDYCADGA